MGISQGGRIVSPAVAAALLFGGLDPLPAARAQEPPSAAGGTSVRVVNGRPIELKVRRLPDGVELVIEGVGAGPQLMQTTRGGSWEGRLSTKGPTILRRGPQRLSLPEAGMQAISIEGGGRDYRISVTPAAGIPVTRPLVSADGRNLILSFSAPDQVSLQTLTPNVMAPARVPQPSYVPPLQPRAVAPPVGDMAVGTMMLGNPSYVNLSGPPVTMTLNNAPAKDVLMALSRLGGYGFVFVSDPRNAAPPTSARTGLGVFDAAAMRPISITFQNEDYGRAVNSALMAAGLQAKREGNMILAGPGVLGKSFGAQMSKVYRLNQASANSAADYLANLGATINKTFTTTSVTSDIQSAGTAQVGSATQTSATATTTQIESYGASQGPLVGLIGTTDSRLGTITLVGEPRLVSVAENYLRQLDLRQRQVALQVRVLDVNLQNVKDIENSFALRWGNNFIVNDRGQMVGAFGRDLPPQADSFRRDIPDDIEVEVDESGRVEITAPTGVRAIGSVDLDGFGVSGSSSSGRSSSSFDLDQISESLDRSVLEGIASENGISTNTLENAIEATISRLRDRGTSRERSRVSSGSSARQRGSTTASGYFDGTRRNPGLNYPRDNFFDFVRAQIVSRSAKLLASPTLILQENPSILREDGGQRGGGGDGDFGLDAYRIDSPIGRRRANEAAVRVGTNVITDVEVTVSDNGVVTCDPELSTAGLTLGARVDKIDDNGFVTFSLSPSVSAVTDTVAGPPECASQLNVLSVRRLDSGAVRVRDGQTLILTGVISDFDAEQVSKWPILGDIPLIGQFFRASGGNREKRELVIMVTPRIVDDEQGGTFGYGVQSDSARTRRFMGQPGF